MPIYEYACGSCGHKLEKLQKIGDDPLRDCPACREAELTKLVSAAAFRLKGQGWYETDFKTGGKKNLMPGGSESDSTSDSSSGPSADTSSTDSTSSNSDKAEKAKADATN